MAEIALLPSQRRWMAEYVERSGFEAADFAWTERTVEYAEGAFPVLSHKQTGFYVIFGVVEDGWLFVERSPGRRQRKDVEDVDVSWRKARAFFQRWLTLLEKEIAAAGDAGRIPQSKAAPFAGPEDHYVPDAQDKPFNAREEDYLTASLDNIQQAFFEHQAGQSLNEDYWRQEFAGVRQAIAELGRLSWKRRLNDLRWNINLHLASKNLRSLWPSFNETFAKMLEKVGLGG